MDDYEIYINGKSDDLAMRHSDVTFLQILIYFVMTFNKNSPDLTINPKPPEMIKKFIS